MSCGLWRSGEAGQAQGMGKCQNPGGRVADPGLLSSFSLYPVKGDTENPALGVWWP